MLLILFASYVLLAVTKYLRVLAKVIYIVFGFSKHNYLIGCRTIFIQQTKVFRDIKRL